MKYLLTVMAGVTVTACVTTPGGKPHDQSIAAHEVAAAESERAARVHHEQYDPTADETLGRCTGMAGARRWRDGLESPCWASTLNPTQHHLVAAARHRKEAADHRAASRALQDAEARACGGVPDEERDTSPFFRTEDIVDVQVERALASGKEQLPLPIGAVITFRAVPGLTAEWLQRTVDCHLARNAALGHEVAEMDYCPLVPRDVRARVSSTGRGFAVSVTSDNPRTAEEITRRAQKLVGRHEPASAQPSHPRPFGRS